MSLELTLMPYWHAQDNYGSSNELIEVVRAQDLFERILRLPSVPVPKKFHTFRGTTDGESCYGNTQTAPYGNPLLATTLAHLKTCRIPGPPGAYVAASPDEQHVALYWR